MAKVYTLRGQRPGGWAKERWEWSKRVRRDGNLSPMARLVAHSLAIGFANSETAECRPGLATLAEDCASSTRTIDRAMTDLERAGWIERKGGNAPGVSAAIRFRFPEDRHATATEHTPDLTHEHAPDLAGEHTPDLTGTHAKSDAPPRPPYMEEPNLNNKNHAATGLHPRAALRPPKRPNITTILVAPGSAAHGAWDDWLAARGFPPLERIGQAVEGGGWIMPTTTAPAEGDQIAYRIALGWAGWLRSR